MSLVLQSGLFLKSLLNASVASMREKSTYLNRPRLRNPVWFNKKERAKHDEQISPENTEFVQEVVRDRFAAVSDSLLKSSEIVQPTGEWAPGQRRTGLIARKIGQYPLWKKDGTKVRTTLLQIIDNHVIKYIPPGEFQPTQKPKILRPNKFGCLMVGAESCDPTRLTKEYCNLFADYGGLPKRILSRFLVHPNSALPAGTPLNVTHFRAGDYVDVRGRTVDRNMQGVMKKHGFKGMPASHGVTKTHRRGGNIGGGGEKARVWPGTKMPGHMGNRYRVLRGLKIWRINTKYNVMWVQGSAIAGETNGIVYVFDSMLPTRRPTQPPPTPTFYEDNPELEENIWAEDIHNFKTGTIQFKEE